MEDIRQKIIPILKKYGVKKAALFGSYARGEQTEESDVDILYYPPNTMSLFELAGIKIDLEEILGKKVDLVSYRAIHKPLKKYIMKDEKILYDQR